MGPNSESLQNHNNHITNHLQNGALGSLFGIAVSKSDSARYPELGCSVSPGP